MNRDVKKFLGLDWGISRVGVAVSDWEGRIALPRKVLVGKDSLDEVEKIIADENIDVVVVGLPRQMDGAEGPSAAHAREFADKIKGAPVEFWDERLTSAMAEKSLVRDADMSRAKRRKVLDAVSAQRILQDYLDWFNNAPKIIS